MDLLLAHLASGRVTVINSFTQEEYRASKDLT